MNPYYQNAKFLISAPSCAQAPADTGMEVAFAGRSNAGKSSAINALCHQKALARTSKTPGRTRLLNFFVLDEERRLVDLPGYGYAKVGDAIKRDWQLMMTEYLERRQSLRGLILLMDSRHPLKEFDQQMLEWSIQAGLPVHILLTKADKLKKGPANAALHKVRREIGGFSDVSVQLFSALKHQGIDTAHGVLDRWLGLARTSHQDPG